MKRENVVLQTSLKELSGQYEKHRREMCMLRLLFSGAD